MASAPIRFPHNTPTTKEGCYIRTIFHSHFPNNDYGNGAEKTVPVSQGWLNPGNSQMGSPTRTLVRLSVLANPYGPINPQAPTNYAPLTSHFCPPPCHAPGWPIRRLLNGQSHRVG